jgi:hypothetical protein
MEGIKREIMHLLVAVVVIAGIRVETYSGSNLE